MPKMTNGNRTVDVTGEVQIAAYMNAGWVLTADKREHKPEIVLDSNDELRAEAMRLGIDFHPNISYERLLERVMDYKAAHTGQ